MKVSDLHRECLRLALNLRRFQVVPDDVAITDKFLQSQKVNEMVMRCLSMDALLPQFT
jgi:hypothetical protein